MQKKFMDRPHLPGNSGKKLQIHMPKVSIRKNCVPRPRKFLKMGSQKLFFLYREKFPRKTVIFPDFQDKWGLAVKKFCIDPAREMIDTYSPHHPKNAAVQKLFGR